MRDLLFYGVVAFALVRGLAWARIPFAVRLWRQMRRFAYLYVALVIVLAVVSAISGRSL